MENGGTILEMGWVQLKENRTRQRQMKKHKLRVSQKSSELIEDNKGKKLIRKREKKKVMITVHGK